MTQPVLPTEETAHSHLVQFYETDEFLVDTVSEFVGASLRDGDASIVIAPPAHRRAFAPAPRRVADRAPPRRRSTGACLRRDGRVAMERRRPRVGHRAGESLERP